MVRERVAENVFLFTSDQYASVNAGAVVGPDWSIVIDTLAFPSETLEIREFIEGHLNSKVRYVINTHYHSDHSFGNCWFDGAVVVGHALCRQLLKTQGQPALEHAKLHNRELKDVEIVLPDVVFSHGRLGLRVGKRVLRLIHLPGHSPDGIGVLIEDDRVLFAGDLMMPVPYLVDGDFDQMVENLKRLPKLKLEGLVQGHGEVILRGEVPMAVKANLSYLSALRRHVNQAARRKDSYGYLRKIGIEDCGKSRILLSGLAEELHQRNLTALYQKWHAAE